MFTHASGQPLPEHTRNPRLDPASRTAQKVHATRLLRSHATCTVGSLSVRKETSSGEKTAAFARRKHSWISLRAQADMFMRQTAAFARHKHICISLCAQKDMFRQNDCCVLSPCAKRHVPAKRLLYSHVVSTLGSLSVRFRDMFRRKDCCHPALPPKIDDFCLQTPDPVSTVKRARPLRYREPVT